MRYLSFFLALILLLSLFSCRRAQIDYLSSLRAPFQAEIKAKIGDFEGSLTLTAYPPHLEAIYLVSPSLPLRFAYCEGQTTLTVHDEIVLLPETESGIPLLFSLFSFSREHILAAKTDEAGSPTHSLTVKTDNLDLILTLDQDLTPLSLKGTAGGTPVSLLFLSFTPI